MAPFAAQPEGPGQFLHGAALFVVHLECQTTLLTPCPAQKLAPARPCMKRQQTLEKRSIQAFAKSW